MSNSFYYSKYGIAASRRKVDWVKVINTTVAVVVGATATWALLSLLLCL